MFSEVAEIARVAARLGQFQQLLKTRVILILNFTRPRVITYTNYPELLRLALTHDRKNVSEELRDSVFVLIWRQS